MDTEQFHIARYGRLIILFIRVYVELWIICLQSAINVFNYLLNKLKHAGLSEKTYGHLSKLFGTVSLTYLGHCCISCLVQLASYGQL